MEYKLTMKLAKVNSMTDAAEVAYETTEMVWENLKAELGRIAHASPAIVNPSTNHVIEQIRNEAYVKELLTLWFAYWPQYRLLGFLDSNLIGPIHPRFTHEVVFQSDGSYDCGPDWWKGLGQPFHDSVRIVKTDGTTEINDLLNSETIYDTAFQKLDIAALIHAEDSPKFRRFAMSPLCSGERVYQACRTLETVVKEYQEKLAQKGE